jgi:hypothetical protein
MMHYSADNIISFFLDAMATDKDPTTDHSTHNDKKQPKQEAVDSSLESPNGENSGALCDDDLAKYRQLLKDLDAFERHQQFDSARRDLHQQMYYRVLSHTKFVNRELLSAVELYKDRLQSLTSLDFVNPTALIKSAEKEMDNIGTSGVGDAARMAQLQTMVKAQKQSLSELKKRWLTISSELLRFACYVRDQMTAIEKLCGASIAILSDCEIARKKERQRIEEIKKHYKTQLKSDLYSNKVTWRDLESAKKEFDVLSGEIFTLGREDISALTELYTAIRDNAKKSVNSIDMLLTEIESKKNGSVKENKDLFSWVGDVLVSLLSDHHIELKASKNRIETADENIIRAIRKEVLDYLLEVVQKERRAKNDRRSLADRRKHNDPNYKGPERRKCKDRRTSQDRRSMR